MLTVSVDATVLVPPLRAGRQPTVNVRRRGLPGTGEITGSLLAAASGWVEELADDVRVQASAASESRFLEPHARLMQKLVDDLRGQRLDRAALGRGQVPQAGFGPSQLTLADVVRLPP